MACLLPFSCRFLIISPRTFLSNFFCYIPKASTYFRVFQVAWLGGIFPCEAVLVQVSRVALTQDLFKYSLPTELPRCSFLLDLANTV